jgi:hypothetical protein
MHITLPSGTDGHRTATGTPREGHAGHRQGSEDVEDRAPRPVVSAP